MGSQRALYDTRSETTVPMFFHVAHHRESARRGQILMETKESERKSRFRQKVCLGKPQWVTTTVTLKERSTEMFGSVVTYLGAPSFQDQLDEQEVLATKLSAGKNQPQ